MKKSARKDIRNHIESLGINRRDDVVVHSRLISFGQIDGDPPSEVYNALRDIIGEKATIAVPTYVFAQPDVVYDREKTPSTQTGIFSEYVRTQEFAIRSRNPVHNHAAIGPKAPLLNKTLATVSIGHGSDFDLFHAEGFKLLLLGCKFSEGATFLHHLEGVVGVPYRKWVVLEKRIRNSDGLVQNIALNYYARNVLSWEEDFDKVTSGFLAEGVAREAAACYGKSFAMSLTALSEAGRSLLERNPYAFVSHREPGIDYIHAGCAG